MEQIMKKFHDLTTPKLKKSSLALPSMGKRGESAKNGNLKRNWVEYDSFFPINVLSIWA